MKYLIKFLFLIIACNFSFSQPADFQAIKFVDYTPKWIHYSIDTSLAFGKIDMSRVRTGMNHFLFNGFSLQPMEIVTDDCFYNVLISSPHGIEGALIEKIDIETGERIWENHYDLRSITKKERPIYTFINSDNELEVINFRGFLSSSDTNDFPFFDGGGAAHLAIHKYSLDTGEELDYTYPSDTDSSTIYLHYRWNIDEYFEKRDDDNYNGYFMGYDAATPYLFLADTQYYFKIMMDPTGHSVDTISKGPTGIPFDQLKKVGVTFGHQYRFGGLKKISNDRKVFLSYLIMPDSLKETLVAGFRLVDKDWNLLSTFDIKADFLKNNLDNKNALQNLKLVYADDDYIVANFDVQWRNYFFVYNLDGELVNTFNFVDHRFNVKGASGYEIDRIKGTDQFLIAYGVTSADYTQEEFGLDFLVSDWQGNLNIARSFEFESENDVLTPKRMIQTESGDFILSCMHSVDTTLYFSFMDQRKYWFYNSIYFPKEDLNLSTKTEDLNELQAFSISPNPSRNNISIHSPTFFSGKIRVFNILGELMKTIGVHSKEIIDIDISDLDVGVYMVRLDSDEGDSFRGRSFVKE